MTITLMIVFTFDLWWSKSDPHHIHKKIFKILWYTNVHYCILKVCAEI